FLLRYVAVKHGPFVFLVAPDRAPSAGPPGSPEQLLLLDDAFPRRDLGTLAARWGDSWGRLKHHFEGGVGIPSSQPIAVQDVREEASGCCVPTGTAPTLSYCLAGLTVCGRTFDHLKLDLSCERIPTAPPPVLEIRWKARAGNSTSESEGSVQVTAERDCL